MGEWGRRVTRVGAAVLVGASLTTAAGAAPAAAEPGTTGCAIERLPVPDETWRSWANLIDPSGRYIVGNAFVGEARTSVNLLWDRGRVSTIDVPAGPVVAVNRRGVVVGNTTVEVEGEPFGVIRPWRYRDGAVTRLPVLDPTHDTSVTAINSAGDAVGIARDYDAGRQYAVRWPAARPRTVEVLRVPADFVSVVAITDNGTVVGDAGSIHQPSGWARRPSGRIDVLTAPDADGTTTRAARGRWAAAAAYRVPHPVAVVFDLRTGASTVLPGITTPEAVNSYGTIVAGDLLGRLDGSVVQLPAPAPGQIVGAHGIANDGTAVGFNNTRDVSGAIHAVRWTGC